MRTSWRPLAAYSRPLTYRRSSDPSLHVDDSQKTGSHFSFQSVFLGKSDIRIGYAKYWVCELSSARIGGCANSWLYELVLMRIGGCANWRVCESAGVRTDLM